MPTFEELEKYYRELASALDSEKISYHFNSDRSHNATVMRLMFDKSSAINMYCGEMSVFRHRFYEYMAEKDPELADKTKRHLIDSFGGFCKRESATLDIIFESFSEEYLKDLIFREDFMNAVAEKKINLYKLSDNFSYKEGLDHFSFTGDKRIVRFELDKLQHSAICTINERVYYDSIKKNYASLKQFALPVKPNA